MNDFNTVDRLHQVLIVDGYKIPDHIPDVVRRNTEYARNLYPDAQYQLWSGESLREFIFEEFDPSVARAFDTLAPYSYKCDLARYCLLYIYGGIYFDLAVRMMNFWKVPKSCEVAAFTEMYPGMESWTATQTSVLWSKPGRPEWEQAIHWIVENCENRFYGPHDHYPTAGGLLGRAFAAAMARKGQGLAADDQWMGEVRFLTPENHVKNVCYVAPDKLLIGLRTKITSGELTEMGLTGTNNYVKIWRQRRAYGEIDQVWKGADNVLKIEDRATRTASGISVMPGNPGRVSFGPFIELDAGTYELSITFSPETRFSRFFVDVTSGFGTEVIYEKLFAQPKPEHHDVLNCTFSLGEAREPVEFRLSVFGDFSGEIRTVELKKIESVIWNFKDPRIELLNVSRTGTGIRIPSTVKGRVIYGPYAAVAAGRYSLWATFGPNAWLKDLLVEVCAEAGNTLVASHRQAHFAEGQHRVEVSFSVTKDYSDVEFRLEVLGGFDGELRHLTLIRHDDTPRQVAVAEAEQTPPSRRIRGIYRKAF